MGGSLQQHSIVNNTWSKDVDESMEQPGDLVAPNAINIEDFTNSIDSKPVLPSSYLPSPSPSRSNDSSSLVSPSEGKLVQNTGPSIAIAPKLQRVTINKPTETTEEYEDK